MNTEMQLINSSNLPEFQKEAVSKLNSEQQGFILAKFGHRKVRDIAAPELKMELHKIATKMIADYTPKDLEDENLQKLCTEWLYNELKGSLSNLTIPEISNAVYRGVRKEYGDWFGYSGATFHLWLKSYLADQRRLDSIQKFNIQLDAPKTTSEPVVKIEIAEESCLKLFEEYKAAPSEWNRKGVMFISFLHYEFLKSKGLMNYTHEEKREMYEQAKREYWDLQKKNGVKPDTIALLKLTGDNQNISIRNETRRIAVRRYFDHLIKNNKQLEFKNYVD